MNLLTSLKVNLQKADIVLACVTRDYVKCKNFERELNYADVLHKKIIPLYMEKMPIQELSSLGLVLAREKYCELYK